MGNEQSKIQRTNFKMDFDIIKEIKKNCFVKNKNKPIIQNCDYLNRLIHSLKYYTLLNVSNSKSDADVFMEFIGVYGEALNDYHHFIDIHSDDLENIHNQLINDKNFGECRLDKCLLFKRHFN
eukprot:12224_1